MRWQFIALGMAIALAGCKDQLIGKAESVVKTRLKDPYTAKFEEVERCRFGKGVMGYVNSKNGYGAYAGREQFFYVDGKLAMDSDNGGMDAAVLFSELESICTEPPAVREAKRREDERVSKLIEQAADEAERKAAADSERFLKEQTEAAQERKDEIDPVATDGDTSNFVMKDFHD